MHKVLLRQLKRLGLDVDAQNVDPRWIALLERVAQTYTQADQDRYMWERSLEVSSAEMMALYQQLRERTDAELHASLALAKAILEAVDEGIVVCDGDRIIQWNRRFVEMWRIPDGILDRAETGELIRWAATRVTAPDAFLENAAKAAATPSAVHTRDTELLDGRILARYAAPIDPGDATSARRIVSFRDVTEERRISTQRAIVAERMMSVGQLVASVAHEINNPLTYIRSNVEFVSTRIAERPLEGVSDIAEALEDVRTGVERLATIVRDLKMLSRADEESRDPVDIERAVDMAIQITHNHVRHRATVVRDMAEMPPAFANEGRLTQVFVNLLVNAADAMPEGRASTNEIRIIGRIATPGVARIEIRDTGAGIPPEVIERVFDPFFTTKPVGVGTGLGLSICKGIIEKLGGRINVESKIGRGTSFVIELPTIDAAPPQAASRTDRPAAMTRRILVIDDDQLVRRGLRRLLGLHQVVDVASVDEGLRALREGTFDIVLCDLMMPDRTGLEMHAEVRHQHPEMLGRLVFLSGGVFTPSLQAFIQQPGIHRLDKPVSSKQLEEVIALVSGAG